MKRSKRIFSLLLTVIMMFSLVSVLPWIYSDGLLVSAVDIDNLSNQLPFTFQGVSILDCRKNTNYYNNVTLIVQNNNEFAINEKSKIHYKTYDSDGVIVDDNNIYINFLNPNEKSYETLHITDQVVRIIFCGIEIKTADIRIDPEVNIINDIYTNVLPYTTNGIVVENVMWDNSGIPSIQVYMKNNTGEPIQDIKYYYDSYIWYRAYDSDDILIESGRLSLLDVNNNERFRVHFYPDKTLNKIIFYDAKIEIGEGYYTPETAPCDSYIMNKDPSLINGVTFAPCGKDKSSFMYNTVKYIMTNNTEKALSNQTKVFYRVYDLNGYCINTGSKSSTALNNGESAYISITGGRDAYEILITDVLIDEDLTVSHVHQNVVMEEKEATCTSPGLTKGLHCIICNEDIKPQLIIDAKGHRWDEGKINIRTSCYSEGEIIYLCEVCGATKVDNIEKLAHTPETIPAVAASCTATGLTEGSKCSVCGTVLVAQQVTEKTAHTSKAAVKENEVAATCTSTGSFDEVVYCSVCGDEITRVAKTVEKLTHTPEVIPAVAATCAATGLTEGSKCSVCGEVLKAQEVIEKLPHTPTNKVAAKYLKSAATCTAKAVYYQSCSVCGEKLTGTFTSGSANGHNWNNGKVTKAATYTATGVKTYICTVCKTTKTEKIAKLKAPSVGKVGTPKATTVKKDSIKLTWSKAKNADKYEVYRSTDGKKWTKVATTTKLTFTDTKLKAGTKYQYKVRGIHSASKATGAYSVVLKTGTLTAAPSITLKSSKSKTATASWKKVTGASKYIVYKSTDGKKWTKVATTTKLTYNLTKLTAGKKIYVKLVAVNAYGKNSAASAVKSVTIKK